MKVYTTLAGDDSQTGPIRLDSNTNPFTVSLAAIGAAVGNAVTVQFTLDDVYAQGYDPDDGNWFPHPDMTAVEEDTAGALFSAVTAVRLVRDSGTDPVDFQVIQAGYQG